MVQNRHYELVATLVVRVLVHLLVEDLSARAAHCRVARLLVHRGVHTLIQDDKHHKQHKHQPCEGKEAPQEARSQCDGLFLRDRHPKQQDKGEFQEEQDGGKLHHGVINDGIRLLTDGLRYEEVKIHSAQRAERAVECKYKHGRLKPQYDKNEHHLREGDQGHQGVHHCHNPHQRDDCSAVRVVALVLIRLQPLRNCNLSNSTKSVASILETEREGGAGHLVFMDIGHLHGGVHQSPRAVGSELRQVQNGELRQITRVAKLGAHANAMQHECLVRGQRRVGAHSEAQRV
mmetsp:Transcript_19889/g.50506  ORF Transcript_19889/g.50506 Transcript_19889/m.50506 type:complete len:289 (+) Transcript_19889:577-1443(+)